jgi:hypothetical protein
MNAVNSVNAMNSEQRERRERNEHRWYVCRVNGGASAFTAFTRRVSSVNASKLLLTSLFSVRHALYKNTRSHCSCPYMTRARGVNA